jgi:hypothetical protein
MKTVELFSANMPRTQWTPARQWPEITFKIFIYNPEVALNISVLQKSI